LVKKSLAPTAPESATKTRTVKFTPGTVLTEEDYLQLEDFHREQSQKRSKKEEKSDPIHKVLDTFTKSEPEKPVEPKQKKIPVEPKAEKLEEIKRIVKEKKQEAQALAVTRYIPLRIVGNMLDLLLKENKAILCFLYL
jgi:hypothetical protein